MVTPLDIFSGFSVSDIDAARTFYRDTLGLDVTDGPMGNLDIALPAGSHVFVYPKPDHEPATFTILNLVVDDIDFNDACRIFVREHPDACFLAVAHQTKVGAVGIITRPY